MASHRSSPNPREQRPHAAIGAALIVLNGQGAKRRRPQAAVADLLTLATRVALRGGTV
jgi:hypothetical protein